MISRAVNAWHRLDHGHHGLALDVGLYAFSALFAGLTAATSTLAPHRAWGAIALWGYAAATLTSALIMSLLADRPGVSANKLMIDRVRAALTILTWATVALVPLVVEAVQRAGGRLDRAQEEVVVTEMAGQRLLDSGTPYLERATIAALPEPDRLFAYVPYQPGMAAFGLPRAVFGDGWWTDARVWFAVATVAALAGAVALLSFEPPLIRAVQAATVLPICALTLATGGDDLPVLALCLLALALVARGRFGAAGLTVGVAGAMKLFAWPVLAVLAVVALRRGAGPRFVAGAIGLPVLALLPAILVDPGAAVENVVRFPLGRGLVTSPAQSPFPGHLIATGLPGGRAIAAVLLVTAGVALAVGLIRRPPGTAASGALWSGYGLLVAILLMPSTRFGYLLYPIAFLVWTPPLRKTSCSSSGGGIDRVVARRDAPRWRRP